MLGRIVVVALDLYKTGTPEFQEYDSLTAKEKLDVLSFQLDRVCQLLTQQQPDAMWIVGWREGVITAEHETMVSLEIKRLHKEIMLSFVHRYPNLTILAGALTSKKYFTDSKKLDDIEYYYNQHQWIAEIEQAETSIGESYEISKHKAQLGEVRKAISEGTSLVFNVIRNTAYVFSDGVVHRHDKHAPMDETVGQEMALSVFQPAKGRNLSPIIPLRHPITREVFLIGVEICREHSFQVLKQIKRSTPLFHFIISDYINLDLSAVAARNVIHFDSRNQSKMVVSSPEQLENTNIQLYRIDLLKGSALIGPIPPVFPFEKKVLRLLNSVIQELPIKSYRRTLLEKLRADFLEVAPSIISKDLYSVLKKFTQQYGMHLKNEYLVPKYGLFRFGPDTEKLMQDLNALVKQASKEYPIFKDISSRPPSP